MAFEKKTWLNGEDGGTPITAEELNRIEQGIEDSLTENDIVDDLLSTSIVKVLSANMGRELAERVANRLALTGGTLSGNVTISKAGSNQSSFAVRNANHHAYFTVSTANNIGIWSETLQKWVVKCGLDGVVSVDGIEIKDMTWKRLGQVKYGSPLSFPDEWNEMLIYGTNGYYIGTVTLTKDAPTLHYLVGIDSNHIRFTISNNVITLQSSKIDGDDNTEATTGFTPYLTVYYR